MPLFPIGSLAIKVGYDLTELDHLAGDVSRVLRSQGSAFRNLGQDLTMGLTLPIVGLGAAATAVAIQFESAFAGVIKTVGGTAQEVAELRQGIQDMALRLPATTTEISAVAQAAGQLGIQRDNILGFTETMIGLGEATNLTAEDAATQLARLANIMQTPQDQFDEMGSAVVALGNNFATTEAEIVHMSMRLAAGGKILGLTEAQVLGMAAALSSVGIEAEAGGTAFTKVFVQIREAADAGGTALDQFATVSGMLPAQFKALAETDPAQAVVAFVQGLAAIEEQGGSATQTLSAMGIQEIRMRNALLSSAGAGDLLARAIETGTQAWADNEALTKEVETRYATLASRLSVLKNQVVAALMPLGEVLADMLGEALPVMSAVARGVQTMFEAFQDLPRPVKNAAVAVAGLLAALGPVLGAIGAWKGVVAVMGPILSGLGAPIAAVVAGVAALVAIVTLVRENWDTLSDTLGGPVTKAVEGVRSVLQTVARALADVWARIAPMVTGVLTDIFRTAKVVLGKVYGFVKLHVDAVIFAWRLWGDEIMAVVRYVWDVLVDGVTSFMNIFGGIIRTVLAAIRGDWGEVWSNLQGVVASVWNHIKLTTLRAIDILLSGFQTFFSIIPGFGEAIGRARGYVQGLIADLRSVPRVARTAGTALSGVGATGAGGVPPAPATGAPGATGDGDGDGDGLAPKGLADLGEEADASTKSVDTLKDVLEDLGSELALLESKIQLGLVDPVDAARERASLLEQAYNRAFQLDTKPAQSELDALARRFANAAAEAEYLGQELPKLNVKLRELDTRPPAFGIALIGDAIAREMVPNLRVGSQWLQELRTAYDAAMGDEQRAQIGLMIQELERLLGIMNEAGKPPQGVLNLKNAVQAIFQDTVDVIQEALSDVIGGTESFGDALASIAGGMLGSLGSILIQEGQILVAAGLGIQALSTALATLQGPVAIAAGLGLIALGIAAKGAMKALGGFGGGGGGRGGASQGVVVSRPYGGSETGRDRYEDMMRAQLDALNGLRNDVKNLKDRPINFTGDPSEFRRAEYASEAQARRTEVTT